MYVNEYVRTCWGWLIAFFLALPAFTGLAAQKVEWLNISVAGRNCPSVESYHLASNELVITLSEDMTLSHESGRRIVRNFCQLSISPVANATDRQALRLHGITVTGLLPATSSQSLQLDFTMYRQGEENHWQDQASLQASAKDRSWKVEKSMNKALDLACKDQKSLQIKLAILSRQTSTEPAGKKASDAGAGFHLHRQLRIPVSTSECSS